MTDATREYPDLHAHLDALRARGLLLTIDEPIDKDAELHALVRWQFVGGIEEAERKAREEEERRAREEAERKAKEEAERRAAGGG